MTNADNAHTLTRSPPDLLRGREDRRRLADDLQVAKLEAVLVAPKPMEKLPVGGGKKLPAPVGDGSEPPIKPKARRGFAAMDPETQRRIASMGGRTAHAVGHAHQFTSEEGRAAGANSQRPGKGNKAPPKK